MDDTSQVTVAAAADCELGECPVWDPERQCVYWTDITIGKMFCLDLTSAGFKAIYRDVPVGGFTLQPNGDLLLFRVNDIALLRRDGAVSVVQEFADDGMARFNDVIADPEGRVFAGTIGKTDQSGGLYRFERKGGVKKLFAGTGCSNGMGFSSDRKIFYWTCSTSSRIFQFDYDQTSGDINNRRLFYEALPSEGIPDGLAVDTEGCVWSARWGGASVVRHAPSGQVLGSIQFPVRNVTSVCFGGENLDQLFVTSAKDGDDQTPAAGSVFQTRSPVRGLRGFRSRICMEELSPCQPFSWARTSQ
jgi:D-xylonolactonase